MYYYSTTTIFTKGLAFISLKRNIIIIYLLYAPIVVMRRRK